MTIAIDALDALALALVTHGHQWTPRERSLYERAISSLSRRGAGSPASVRGQYLRPSLGQRPASAANATPLRA